MKCVKNVGLCPSNGWPLTLTISPHKSRGKLVICPSSSVSFPFILYAILIRMTRDFCKRIGAYRQPDKSALRSAWTQNHKAHDRAQIFCKQRGKFTFPCWLLVTFKFCVIDPFPLAGRVLPLAGSKSNWRNWKLKYQHTWGIDDDYNK